MSYDLPDLPYAYDALEPYIDAQTMELHHDKHHGGYVKKVNDALSGTDWEDKSIQEVLQNLNQIPEEIRTKVRNNGGGHYNHSLFWPIMSPDGGGEPEGELADAVKAKFGEFSKFKEIFSETAGSVFGSGWAWLVVKNGDLEITSTPNQDSPMMEGVAPIMGLDVWEHAYYLKYQNKRPEYIDNWWNVVNWMQVSENYSNTK